MPKAQIKKVEPKRPRKKRPEDLTVEQVETAINIPVERWPGNCYTIATAIVRAKLVEGVAVYGHFLGKINRSKNAFYHDTGSTQHGWVALLDGRIFDPTRWVFENKKPYLHLGEPTKEYDEGGNTFNQAVKAATGTFRPPAFDPSDRQYEFTEDMIGGAAYGHAERLLRIDVSVQEPGFLTARQIHWLANVHFDQLQPHAHEIYQAIKALDLHGFIPIDNFRKAERLSR